MEILSKVSVSSQRNTSKSMSSTLAKCAAWGAPPDLQMGQTSSTIDIKNLPKILSVLHVTTSCDEFKIAIRTRLHARVWSYNSSYNATLTNPSARATRTKTFSSCWTSTTGD